MLYLHHWRLNWTHEWRSPAASRLTAPCSSSEGGTASRPEAEISPQTSRSHVYLPVIRSRGLLRPRDTSLILATKMAASGCGTAFHRSLIRHRAHTLNSNFEIMRTSWSSEIGTLSNQFRIHRTNSLTLYFGEISYLNYCKFFNGSIANCLLYEFENATIF